VPATTSTYQSDKVLLSPCTIEAARTTRPAAEAKASASNALDSAMESPRTCAVRAPTTKSENPAMLSAGNSSHRVPSIGPATKPSGAATSTPPANKPMATRSAPVISNAM
jgi:hypothetical protein